MKNPSRRFLVTVAILLSLTMLFGPLAHAEGTLTIPDTFIIVGNRCIDFSTYWMKDLNQSARTQLVADLLNQLRQEGVTGTIPVYWRLNPGEPLEDLRNNLRELTPPEGQEVIDQVIAVLPSFPFALAAVKAQDQNTLTAYFSQDVPANIDEDYFVVRVGGGDETITVTDLQKSGRVATLTLDAADLQSYTTGGRITVNGLPTDAQLVTSATELTAALADSGVKAAYLAPGQYEGYTILAGSHSILVKTESAVQVRDAIGIAVALGTNSIDTIEIDNALNRIIDFALDQTVVIASGNSISARYPTATIFFAPGQTGVNTITKGSNVNLLAPALIAENFNTHAGTADYKGINVGFHLEDLTTSQINSIKVRLFSGENLLAENTAKMEAIRGLGDAVVQHSTPFIVTEGTYEEQYWDLGSYDPDSAVKPTRAVIAVVDKFNRTFTAELTSLSESTLYERLFVSYAEDAVLAAANGAGAPAAMQTALEANAIQLGIDLTGDYAAFGDEQKLSVASFVLHKKAVNGGSFDYMTEIKAAFEAGVGYEASVKAFVAAVNGSTGLTVTNAQAMIDAYRAKGVFLDMSDNLEDIVGPINTLQRYLSLGAAKQAAISDHLLLQISLDDNDPPDLQCRILPALYELVTDTTAPSLVAVQPVKGTIVLGPNDKFVWTVVASDDHQLYELEVDHNIGSLPEFSVYADAANPYGSTQDRDAFTAAGVTVTYSSGFGWTIDFGTTATNALVAQRNVEFYIVLKDLSGNQFGTMYGTTPDNTFQYSIYRDEDAPAVAVTAPSTLAQTADSLTYSFVVTDMSDLAFLEIDHSLGSCSGTPEADQLPEFTLYPQENPWGSEEAKQLAEGTYGVTAGYNSQTKIWTLAFNQGTQTDNALASIKAQSQFSVYYVVEDMHGNAFGSMSPTAPENTVVVTILDWTIDERLHGATASLVEFTADEQTTHLGKADFGFTTNYTNPGMAYDDVLSDALVEANHDVVVDVCYVSDDASWAAAPIRMTLVADEEQYLKGDGHRSPLNEEKAKSYYRVTVVSVGGTPVADLLADVDIDFTIQDMAIVGADKIKAMSTLESSFTVKAPLAAVNSAQTVEGLQDALESYAERLGIDLLGDYADLSDNLAVVGFVLEQRGGGFTTSAQLQAAFNEGVAAEKNLEEALAAVNVADTAAEMQLALETGAEYLGLETGAESDYAKLADHPVLDGETRDPHEVVAVIVLEYREQYGDYQTTAAVHAVFDESVSLQSGMLDFGYQVSLGNLNAETAADLCAVFEQFDDFVDDFAYYSDFVAHCITLLDEYADLSEPTQALVAEYVGSELSNSELKEASHVISAMAEWMHASIRNTDQNAIYATIQDAIDGAATGETITVASGNYEGNLEIDVPELTLMSVEKHGAVLKTVSGFNAGSGYGGITVLADGVTIDGFTIEQGVAQAVIHTHDSSNVTIANNSIVGLNGLKPRGIDVGYASAASDGVTIQGNTFTDLYCGVYVNQGTDLTVDGNQFTNMGDGAVVFDGTWPIGDVVVINNTATDADYLLYFSGNANSVDAHGNSLDSNTELTNWGVYNSVEKSYFATIQSAVDAAADGASIMVSAGTYAENISIPVGLDHITLLGANSGVAAGVNPAQRGPETVVNGQFTSGGGGQSDWPVDITIDGFTVNTGGGTAFSMRFQGTLNISNNTIDAGWNGTNAVYGITSANHSYAQVEQVAQYHNNTITNARLGINVGYVKMTGSITGNLISNTYKAIATGDGLSTQAAVPVAFVGNRITDSEYGAELFAPNTSLIDNRFEDNCIQVWDRSMGSTYDLGQLISDNSFDAAVTMEDGDKIFGGIQAAIDAVYALPDPGVLTTYTINVPAGTYTEDIGIIQSPNKNIVLQPVKVGEDYADVTMQGTIKLDGQGRWDGVESLTIQGFTFDFSGSPDADIISAQKLEPSTYNYLHNVYIKDSQFVGNPNATVVGIRFGSGQGVNNANIVNCTGTDLHSLGQFTGVTGVTITGCTIADGAAGFNLNNSSNITITGFEFEGTGNGVRVGPDSPAGNTLVIADSIIVGTSPCTESNLSDPDTALVLRSSAPQTITITNSTIKNTNSGSYAIVNQDGTNSSAYTIEVTEVDTGSGRFDRSRLGGLDGANVIVNSVENTTQGTFYASIQTAVNLAANGDTIVVGAGTYSESVVVNKPLTLRGANYGVDPNTGNRGVETILTGRMTLNGDNTIAVDGFKFFNSTKGVNNQTAVAINGIGNYTVSNCKFERDNGNTDDQDPQWETEKTLAIRGIEISSAGSGSVVIEKNLFTGSRVKVFRNSSWNSAIYVNGGDQTINITDNVFDVNRTALNLDDFSSAITVTGNKFAAGNGSHISFGGVTATTGSYAIADNDFALTDTVFNLSNVNNTFRLDATGNTFDSKTPETMSMEELFTLEGHIYHKGKEGRNGLVTIRDGQLFVTKSSGTLAQAIAVADANDTVNIAAGEYTLAATVTVNKPGLKVVGAGRDKTIFNVTAAQPVDHAFELTGAGVTLEGIRINKTDNASQNLVGVGANDVTVRNNWFQGLYILGDNEAARALEISTCSGLLVEGNTIQALRQPAYINPNTTGLIKNNHVVGTRGWVVDQALVEFVGNSWEGNYVDIALLRGTTFNAPYNDLAALSAANNNAKIEDQRIDPNNIYVQAGTTGGEGSPAKPFATIQAGIDAVAAGGTVHVAAGNYAEQLVIDRPLTLLGAQANVKPVAGGRTGGESVIMGNLTNSQAITIRANDVMINGFEIADFFYGINTRGDDSAYRENITIVNNYMHSTNGHFAVAFGEYTGDPARSVEDAEFANLNVSDNYIDVSRASNAGIRFTSHYNFMTFTDVTVESNFIKTTGTGIFGSADTGKYRMDRPSIDNNVFEDNLRAFNLGNMYNASFQGNTLTDNARGASIGMVSGTVAGNTFASTVPHTEAAYHLAFWGLQYNFPVGSSNISVTGNDFQYNAVDSQLSHGVWLQPGCDAATITFHNNNFRNMGAMAGALAMVNDATGQVDAANNWWGTAVAEQVTALVDGDVNVNPWYIDATMTKLCTAAAVELVNNTTNETTMQTVLSTNKVALGLDMTAYYAHLTETGRLRVALAVVGAKPYGTIEAVQTVFNNAVTTQKLLAPINTASSNSAMMAALDSNGEDLDLAADYFTWTEPYRLQVATHVLSSRRLRGYATADELIAVFNPKVVTLATEANAVVDVNAATDAAGMRAALENKATALGLGTDSGSDYSGLPEAYMTRVAQRVLVGKPYADKAAIASAFASAVAAEKAEADAVNAVNGASAEELAAVLVANANALGLDLTDFNGLLVHYQGIVVAEVYGVPYADAAAIKTAFNVEVGLVKDESAAVKDVNNAVDVAAMRHALEDPDLDLTYTDYNGLISYYQDAVAEAMLGEYSNRAAVETAFTDAVADQKAKSDAVKAVNDAGDWDWERMKTAIEDNAGALGLDLTEYDSLPDESDRNLVAAILFDQMPDLGYANDEAIAAVFAAAVNEAKV